MQTPTAATTRIPAPATFDANAPAFPAPVGARHTGISILDYLATAAMQGLITHGMKVKADRAVTEAEKDDEMAERAYNIATAMIRARSQALKQLQQA